VQTGHQNWVLVNTVTDRRMQKFLDLLD